MKGLNHPDLMGGEEFAVLLANTDLKEGLAAAERLAKLVRKSSKVTMSFGVSSTIPISSAAKELYNAADKALYKAKKEGRDCIVAG